ncbi:NADH-quinone oxidoreductase subunit G [Paenalcaligenes hominis]|uniref:NADH-quinone oxidoreductase subunit G n=2 Tax=Paenalcaligenes hominis TaxID=643674 RepID=A0ABX0WPD3_9BURK|nr:NADH-quinone oxidoreductase subunit NuoG [Paenalcaligenes hominis]NJB63797.1 NADH-quinone oxidoreductase subunit G [Paenalcaligenes hominis]GGE60729.1 NADH-quinone oxidoreductase [Paenalcaligenes hominis]
MVELTIDGIKLEAPEGSMVIQAAHEAGVYVPHFCYHKKLSIAANCRMCLVDVEKAPKPLPACATPVTNGMIVHTRSEKAIAAQKDVMEFLLINHPLDCPVCDQGGECQLQDLAVGYGGSTSRYKEEKRVVSAKSMGPLISTEAMQRCIQCTRCVRTGEEIAGIQEVGMVNRGEHAEITTFVGRAVESELSGNMIDVCPVGALLSKPFHFKARSWELGRRRTISPHDSLGANLVVHTKRDHVLRVVPFENEAVNECWISDKDRFAYAGLYQDRLEHPMIRENDGSWREASWNDALQMIVHGVKAIQEKFGNDQIGAIGSATSTTEELALLARLTRALGSENVDFRLRQTDARFDQALTGVPWLGMPLTELNQLDRVIVIGSFLRKDHPLMAQRLRQAVKQGAQVSFIDSAADDPLFTQVAGRMTVAPSQIANAVAEVSVALAQLRNQTPSDSYQGLEASEQAQTIAQSVASGERVAVFLGNMAVASDQASVIMANAAALAKATNAKLGFLTAGGNTVGGYLAGATPQNGGLTAEQMLAQSLRAYFVLNVEPSLDSDLGERAVETLKGATLAVALTPYRSAAQDWADVMLPIAPFTETSGTFVNAEGRAQSFKGVAAPVADSRPAWKVLRVLGNLFALDGFEEETSETVRDTVLSSNILSRLSNDIAAAPAVLPAATTLERVTEVPIYRTDSIARRSEPLQQTPASALPTARMAAATLADLQLVDGDKVRVRSAQGEVQLFVQLDASVATGCVRIAAAFAETAALGSAFGQLTVERV